MKNDEESEKSAKIESKIIPLNGMGSLPQNIEEDYIVAGKKNFDTFNKFFPFCKTSKNIGKFKNGRKVRQGKCNDCTLSYKKDVLNAN